MPRPKAFRENWKVGVIATLLILDLFLWSTVYAEGSQENLSVHFLDVGQGDAIFIETPDGSRMLIDGGANRKVLTELGRALPFGDTRIDIVLATHPDTDHIGGLTEVVGRFDVGLFIESGAVSQNSASSLLDKKLEENSIQRILSRRGMVVDFGGGVILTIIFPNQDVSKWDANDASVVARLDYGEDSFLLTGDIELRTENLLAGINSGELDADVLKVGHHGSRTSTSATFLSLVSPVYSVISAGKDNRYGHPHEEVVNRLEKTGSIIFNTAENGTIIFETDGKTLKVK